MSTAPSLIAHCSPLVSVVQGKEVPLTNVMSSSTTAMSGINLSHSVFFAKVVNKRTFSSDT